MTGDTNPISELTAIDRIVAELMARNLIDPSQREQLAKDLAGGVYKAEDWRLLAEKALMLAEKGHG